MPLRIDPWGVAIPKDYTKLMREFGIEPFKGMLGRVPEPHYLMRRKVIFGHRDFRRVLDAIRKGEKFVVMTGLMPSGKMHLGHKLVIDQLIWYQKRRARIYLCVADLEAYSARGLSFEDSRRYAVDEYLANYSALGLDLRKCNIYFQSKSDAVRHLGFILSKKVTFSEMRAIYGFAGESHISHIFYPMIDVADILHPQLEEFEGPCPTVVPVGIDQDPHLRLARDIASRFEGEFGFILPSSTYHRLLQGLTGDKMASSKPETAIFLTDSGVEVKEKIKDAFTGGQPTAEEQRKLGGNPDMCMIYQLYVYHLLPGDKELLELRDTCRSGELICGDCKARAIELTLKFLKAHQAKCKGARTRARRFSAKA